MTVIAGMRVFATGEKPVSPIIRDVVYIISDVREEPAVQMNENETVAPHWSYVIDEVISFGEYLKRVTEEHEAEIAEIDGALFELAEMACGGM